MEMVLCDLATSSTCSFRTLSISCSAIAFTRASCQTDHANVEVVRTSAGLHRRQTDEQKGSRRQAPALVIMVWAADMSLFHKSLATSQIRDISSSFRTAAGTLSHSHLALTLLRGARHPSCQPITGNTRGSAKKVQQARATRKERRRRIERRGLHAIEGGAE